ncbi:MAG TPA: DUF4185 domain-containing protein [Tepidisphaeraceae bacterium]|nr:DUF4185 domain-containing protein [Tepidisphaeraceae bacterium]
MKRTLPIQVLRARDLGAQFVDNPHRMVGQDGAFSFPLPDGSSFWFFGDTLTGSRPKGCSPWMIDGKMVDHRDMTGQGPYEQMINNTGLILPRQSGANGLRDFRYITDSSGQLKNLLPLEGDEHPDWDRIWCQGGIAIDGKIILSFIQVRMIEKYDGPLPIGFEIVGSGFASAPSPGTPGEGRGEGSFANFERCQQFSHRPLFGAHEPHYGVAFLPLEDLVYIYGTVNQEGGHRAYVARTSANHITNPNVYEYFAGGDRWSEQAFEASSLFGNMPSEMSISFNEHLNCFLAVHSLDLTGQIVARTAPNPWGPWSAPVTLWQIEPAPLPYELPYPFRLTYAGKEHPQLSPDRGKTIYLTYIEFEEYFPHLIEVELA